MSPKEKSGSSPAAEVVVLPAAAAPAALAPRWRCRGGRWRCCRRRVRCDDMRRAQRDGTVGPRQSNDIFLQAVFTAPSALAGWVGGCLPGRRCGSSASQPAMAMQAGCAAALAACCMLLYGRPTTLINCNWVDFARQSAFSVLSSQKNRKWHC